MRSNRVGGAGAPLGVLDVAGVRDRLEAALERFRSDRLGDVARAGASLADRIEHLVDELRRGDR